MPLPVKRQQALVIQLAQFVQSRAEHLFLPYAAGLLQAYALRHAKDLSRYIFLPIAFERLPLAEQHFAGVDVLACSTYVWNMEYSLAVSRQFKFERPNGLVVLGGPQVPDAAEDFLRQHPWVDGVCHGAGEHVFLEMLEGQWENVDGISFLDPQGVFQHNPQVRKNNLHDIPSPYLAGIFDPLLKKYHRRYQWQMLWETNRGCPFSCTFCDWGSATAAKVYTFEMERLKKEVDWASEHRIQVLNCCDANFGIFPRDQDIASYAAEVHQKTGFPQLFLVQGAKNVTERIYQVQKTIIDAGMHSLVTLSLQSVSERTLKAIRRENISLSTFQQLQRRFLKEGVRTYTDMLVGLPGETYQSYIDGVDRVISEGQHHRIQFFNVYILPNAELAQPAYREAHGVLSVRVPYAEPQFPLSMEVTEWHEMVIGSRTLPLQDWRRIRLFTWWVELLYFSRKMLQLPLLFIHQHAGLSFKDIFCFYAESSFSELPITGQLQTFLKNKALAIQEGEIELCAVTQASQPYWLTVSDFLFVGLQNISEDYYAEQFQVLNAMLKHFKIPFSEGLLKELLELSRRLFVNYPTQSAFEMTLHSNIWQVYQAALVGDKVELQPETVTYNFIFTGPPRMDIVAVPKR